MTKDYKTNQENFWATEFGDEYSERNTGDQFLKNQIHYFTEIFDSIKNDKTKSIKSVIEFGANIGVNLNAIKTLLPSAELAAIEINEKASREISEWSNNEVKVYNQSILEFEPDSKRDFVFTKGVLIHINPDELVTVYEKLYQASSKYVCIGEYYNPSPMGIEYRGHKDRLFKRDFCKEIMEMYPDLKLISYGFSYHGDPEYPQDDITWFLMEKV
jgi:pseudaminic acid biosynthesis-associated methylase